MEAMTMADHGVPIGPGKMRKTLTLPKELVAQVRAFRFRGQFEQESDAYVWLIKQALEQVEQEAKEQARKR